MPQQQDGLRHFMVGLHKEHRVEAVGREQRIIALAQNGTDIWQLLLLDAITDVMEIGRIDVDGIDPARASDPACGTHAEPARTGTDVGNCRPGVYPQQVHDPVDLQLLVSFWVLKNR
jgi:hypothetical protein